MITVERKVLHGWGLANHARSLVYRPRGPDEVVAALNDARRRSLSVAHRGSGQSYGDAALNQGGAVVELGRLDRILEYDPEDGVVRAQAGVTVEKLWKTVVGDGWWPPVVPGTSRPTLGGCAAMNVHGKNHVQAGSFGEHVQAMTVLDGDGEPRRISREDPEFSRHIGGQGLLGTILDVTIELRRVHSGFLEVTARTTPNLREALHVLEVLKESHDYTVGWIDCFPAGDATGRAELHAASHVAQGHPLAGEGLTVNAQEPSARIAGMVPRHWVAPLLQGVVHDAGMRAVNAGKYHHARLSHPSGYAQSHATFHFLLDYIPNWRQVYWPGGLIQYQFFVPESAAVDVFEEALRLQNARKVYSYLGVVKRHREDPFESNYSVDGCSLALDFPVRRGTVPNLMSLVRDFDALQRDAGGRVYAAKDAVSALGRPPERRSPFFSNNLFRRWDRSSSE